MRSQLWSPRGPISRETKSPALTVTLSMGSIFAAWPRSTTPPASFRRSPPRRSSSDQVRPLPHSGWAWTTRDSIRARPVIGLRQPTATFRVGEGWTATLRGFRIPGMRTSRSDELATMLGVWGLPQPLMNGYPPLCSADAP